MDLFFPHEDRDRLDFKNSAMLVGFEELTAECMANIHLLQPHDRLAVLLIAWKKIGEFLTANLYTHNLGSVVCWVGKYTLELWFGRDWIVCTAENKSTLIDHMMKVYPAAYVLMHPYCWAHMFTIYNDPWMVEYLNFNFQRMNGTIEPPQILDAKDSEFIHREGISLILLRVIHMFEFRMLKLVKYLCVRLLWAYEDKKSSAYKMLHATPNAAEYMDYVRHVYLISICEYNGTSDLHFLIECIQRNCHCALSETETLHKSAQTIAEGLQSSKNTLSNFFNTFILKTRERHMTNAFGSAVNKYLIFITEYQLKKLFAMSSNEFTPAWEAIYQKLIRMFLIQRESSEELMKNTKDVAEKLFFGVRNLKSLTFAYEQVKQLTRPEWYTSKIGLLLSIITRKLNILEEFKFIANKTVEELLKMEEDLSNYYRDFAKLLVKAPYLEQEAWLTTFSLHPCKDYMDAVTKCGSRNLRAIKKQAIKIKAIPGPEPKPPIKVDDKLVNIIKEETDRIVQMETNDILSPAIPTPTPLATAETESNQPSTSAAALLEAEFKQPSTSAAFLAAIQASAGLNEKKIVEPKTVKVPKKRGPRSKYNKKDKVEKKKLTNSGIKSGGRGRPIGSTKIKSEMIKNLDQKLVKTANLKTTSTTVTAAAATIKPEVKESKFKDLAEAIYSAAAGAADDISTKTVESIKYPSFALMNSVTDTEELVKYTDYDDQIAQYHELNRILHSLRLKHCHYDDILALIIYPRYKRLTWATTWRNLKKRCRDLLNKENKKVLLVQQYMADANDRLTHLNIDYDKYKDKPQIDYGSIEDGYECFDSDSDDDVVQPVVANSTSTKEVDTTSSPKTAKRRKRSHPIKPPLKYTELSVNNTKGNDDNKIIKEAASNGITNQTENIVPSIISTLKTSLSTPIYLNQPVYIVRRPTDNSSNISPQILAQHSGGGGKGPQITVNSIETISSPLLNVKNLSPSDSDSKDHLANEEKPRTSPTFSLVSGSSMQIQPQCKLITIKNQPNTTYTLNQPLNLHSTTCLQPSESLNYTNQNLLNKSPVCPYVPQLTVVTAPQPQAVTSVSYKSNSQLHNLQMIPKQSHIDTTQMTKPPPPPPPSTLKPSSSTPNLSGSEDQPEDLTMPKKATCMLPIKLAKPPQNLPLNLTARTSSMLTNTDDLGASASESEYTNDDDEEEDDNIRTDSSRKSTYLPPPTEQANDQPETFYQMSSTSAHHVSDSTLNNLPHSTNNDNANIIYDLTTTNNLTLTDVQQRSKIPPQPKQLVTIGNIGNNNENYDKQETKKKEENGQRQILAPTTSKNISQLNDITQLEFTIAEGERTTTIPNILNLQHDNAIKIIPKPPGSVALIKTGNSGSAILKGQLSPNRIENLVVRDNICPNKSIYRIEGKIVDMVNIPVSDDNVVIVQNSNVPKVVALTTRKIISVRGTGNPSVIAPSKVPLTDAVGRILTVGSKFSLTPEGVKIWEAARKAGSPPQTAAENLTVETKSETIVTMEIPKVPICLSIEKCPTESSNLLLTTLTSPISTTTIPLENDFNFVRPPTTAESMDNKNTNKMLQLSIETTNNLSSQVTNILQQITESCIEKRIIPPSSKNTPQLIPGTSKEIVIKWSPPSKNKSEPSSSPPKNTSEQISQPTRGHVVALSPSNKTTMIKKITSTTPSTNTSEVINTQSSRPSIVGTSPPRNTTELITTQSSRPSIVATSPPKNISEPTTIIKNLGWWSPPKNTSEPVLQATTAKIVASFPPKNLPNPIAQATTAKIVASFPPNKNPSNPIAQATTAKIVASFPPKKPMESFAQAATTPKIVASFPPTNTSESSIPIATRAQIVALTPDTSKEKRVESTPNKNTSELIPETSGEKIIASFSSNNKSQPPPTREKSIEKIVASSPPKSKLQPISESPSIGNKAISPPYKSQPAPVTTSIEKKPIPSPPHKNTSQLISKEKVVASPSPKNILQPIQESSIGKVPPSPPSKNKFTIPEQSVEKKPTISPPSLKEKMQTNLTEDQSVDVTPPKPLKGDQIVVKNASRPFNMLPSSSKITISQPTIAHKSISSPPKKDNNVTDNVKILRNDARPPINDTTILKTDNKDMNARLKLSPVEKIPIVVNLTKNEDDPTIDQSLPNTSQSIKSLTEDKTQTTVPSMKFSQFCADEWDSDLSGPNTSQSIKSLTENKSSADKTQTTVPPFMEFTSFCPDEWDSDLSRPDTSQSIKSFTENKSSTDKTQTTVPPFMESPPFCPDEWDYESDLSRPNISHSIKSLNENKSSRDKTQTTVPFMEFPSFCPEEWDDYDSDLSRPNTSQSIKSLTEDKTQTTVLPFMECAPFCPEEWDYESDVSRPNTSHSIKSLTENKSSEDKTQKKLPSFCPDEWDSDLSRSDSPVDLTLDSDTQSQGEAPIHEILNDKDKVLNNNLLDPHLKTYKNVKGFPKIDQNDPWASRRVFKIKRNLRAVIKDVRFNVKNFPLDIMNPPRVISYMEVDTDNEHPLIDDNSQSSMMSFYDPLDIRTTRKINTFRRPKSLKRKLSPNCHSPSPVAVKRPSLDKDPCDGQTEDLVDLSESSSDDEIIEESSPRRFVYNPVAAAMTPTGFDSDDTLNSEEEEEEYEDEEEEKEEEEEEKEQEEEKRKISLKRPSLSKDVACEAQTGDSVDLFGSSTEAETKDRQLSFYNIFSSIAPMVSGTNEIQNETEDALARITLKPLPTEEEEKVALKRLSLGKDACEAAAHIEDSVDLFESSTEADTEVQRLRLFNLYSPITPMVSDIDEMQSEAEVPTAILSPKQHSSTEEKDNNITTNLIELIQEVTGAKNFNPEPQIMQLVSNETKNQTNEENNSQSKVTHIGINERANEEGKQAISSMFPDGPRKVGEYWAYAQVVDQTPENLERVNKIFNKLKTTVQLDTNPVPPSTTQAAATTTTTEIEFKPLSVPIRRMIMRARYVVFNQAYINEREKFVAEVAKQGVMERNEDSTASILIARFVRDNKSFNDDSFMSLLQKQVGSDGGECLSSALIGVVLKVTMSGAALRRNINVDENEQPTDNQQQNGREKVDASTTLHEFYLEKRAEVGYAMYSPIISLNKLLDGTLEESVPIPRECFGSDEEEEKLPVSLNNEQIIRRTTPATESETSVTEPIVVKKRPKRKIQTRKQAGKNVPITRRASLRSLNKNQTVSALCRSVSPSDSTQDSKKPLSQDESDDNTDAELDIIYECATMSTANDSEDDTGSEYEPRTSRPKVVKPMRLRCIGRRSTNRVLNTTETSSCSSFAIAQQRTRRQFAAKSTSSHRTRRSQLLMEATTRNTIQRLSAADKAALLHYKCVDVEVRLNRLSYREAEMCRKPVIKLERHAAIGKYLKVGENQELQENNNETDDDSIYSENLDDEENEADDESEDMDKDEFKKKPTRRHSLVVGLRKQFTRNLKNKAAIESESCSETSRRPTRVSKRRSTERNNQHEQKLREQQVSGKDIINTRRTTPLVSESSGTEEDEDENDEITSNCSSERNGSDHDDDDDDDDDDDNDADNGNGSGNAGRRATSRSSISGNTAAGSSNNVTTASSSKQSTANTNETPSTSRKRGNMRSHNCNTATTTENGPILNPPKNATKNGNNVVVINSSSEEDTTNANANTNAAATEGASTNTEGTGNGTTEPTTAPPSEDTGARSVTLAQIIRILRENLITTGSRHLSSKPAVPECIFQNSVAESITATIHPPTETTAQRVEISHNLAPVDVIDRLRDIIRRTLARLTVVERNSERRLARQRRERIRNDRIARNNENIRQLRLLEERLNERVSRRRSLSSSSESRCSTPELPSCQDPRNYMQFYPDYGQSGASSPAYSTPEY